MPPAPQHEPVSPTFFQERVGPQPPAAWGWRGRVNRFSGGRLKFAAREDEVRHRQARQHVLRKFLRTQTIVVANPKGGANKTPTTAIIAATFGWWCGGSVLAWDNNETRGTLGLRTESAAHELNVMHLLRNINGYLQTAVTAGEMHAYLRPQSARFDVLASDDEPGSMEEIDGLAYNALSTVLARYYRMMVVDTGNNERAKNWLAAVATADCLVVPMTVQRDVATHGLKMLDHIKRRGGAELVANAVAVVSCSEPNPDQELLEQIVNHYKTQVRAVLIVPFDPVIRAGDRITYERLSPASRNAWLEVCAAITDSLAAREDLALRYANANA